MTVVDPASYTPAQVRSLCREGKWTHASTAGVCEGHVQANVIILPAKYADDFRLLCMRNPCPCPLLGETKPGDPTLPPHLAKDAHVTTDCPSYSVYRDGKCIKQVKDIRDLWKEDSVAFFIGCSYSFEATLMENGLVPRHVELGTKVPMYRTTTPLCSAGPFRGTMVVSMRPYKTQDLGRVRDFTAPFVHAHGEPVAYGLEGAQSLGIDDPDGTRPHFGDATEIKDGEQPVYWGCGVTPQNVVMDSNIPDLVIGHTPGSMLVLDMRNDSLRG